MKNYDYWKQFIRTGKVDDYLTYIACTREDNMEEYLVDKIKEGDFSADINCRNGNGSVGHAGW